jgi:nitrate/nitrite transport system permease protein
MSAEAQFETVVQAKKAKVFAFPAPSSNRRVDLRKVAANVARSVVPPLIVVLLVLLVWQIACATPGSSLPPPSKIWEQAKRADHRTVLRLGGNRRISGSPGACSPRCSGSRSASVLQPCGRAWRLGAFIGQSVWAMRGLDPIFQVLRTVPPLAWLPLSLAAFRDSQPSAIFVIFITAYGR